MNFLIELSIPRFLYIFAQSNQTTNSYGKEEKNMDSKRAFQSADEDLSQR